MALQVHLRSRLCRSNGADMGEQVASARARAAALVNRFLHRRPAPHTADAVDGWCGCFDDKSSPDGCANYRGEYSVGAWKVNYLPQR